MAGTTLVKEKSLMVHADLEGIKLTPIQEKLLEILSDGENHSREELLKACGPAGKATVKAHICYLRKKLRGKNHEIVTVYIYPNKIAYRHMRHLHY